MASIYASNHNAAMNYIFSKLESIPTENVEAVVMGIYGDFCTRNGWPFPIGTGPFNPFPEDFRDLDLRGLIAGSSASQDLKATANQLLDVVERALPYNEYSAQINQVLAASASTLRGDDLATAEDMASVAHQSHQLYNSPNGGVTPFVGLVGDLRGQAGNGGTGEPVAQAIDWGKVLACDIVGGIFGGPGGYVAASTISVIMQS